MVCGTAGPGVTHLIQGLLDALHENCPVIALSGDVETSLIGLGYLEEVNPYQHFQTSSLFTARVVSPETSIRLFGEAIRTSILQRGPVVIALPGDVAAADSPVDKVEFYVGAVPAQAPAPEDLEAIAKLINDAETVAIFGGDGCRGAKQGVIDLAAKVKAPVGFSFKGKQWLEAENPHAVGMTGLLGYGGCFYSLSHADLILMLGTDFPFPEFLQAGHAKVVQVDARPKMLGRRLQLAAGCIADVSKFLDAVLPLVAEKSDDGLLTASLKKSQGWQKENSKYVVGGDARSPIRPEYLVATLNELMAEDAVLTVDTGTACMWTAHQFTFTGDRRMFGSLSWASMANAAPNAAGIKWAAPDRQVVGLSGDGGFTMLAFGDLITEVNHGLEVVHVVLNNGELGFVNIEMQEAGITPFYTGLTNPNFAKIADAFGAKGVRVEDPKDVRRAVTEALAHRGGPVVLDVVVDPTALAVPSHVPAKTMVGFTLGMAKRVLSGHADEVLTEAKRNIRLL